MRRALIVIALALSAGSAFADGDKEPPQPGKPIATAAVVDKLDVFKDDFGGFYVSPKPNAFKDSDDNDKWVFFGDKKGVFQQTIVGSSTTNGGDYDWTIWSPRVKNMQQAQLTLVKGAMALACERHDAQYKKKPLTQLTDDQAKAFVKATPFYPKLWQRQAHFLARDDDGMYFYVDRWSDDHGGQGYRVFAGMKGQMKQLVMTNVVSDSAGEIFATKGGDLKIVTKSEAASAGRSDPISVEAAADFKAYWKKGEKKAELVVLPLMPNRYLIYRELGIYGRLGVVCDDT